MNQMKNIAPNLTLEGVELLLRIFYSFVHRSLPTILTMFGQTHWNLQARNFLYVHGRQAHMAQCKYNISALSAQAASTCTSRPTPTGTQNRTKRLLFKAEVYASQRVGQ